MDVKMLSAVACLFVFFSSLEMQYFNHHTFLCDSSNK